MDNGRRRRPSLSSIRALCLIEECSALDLLVGSFVPVCDQARPLSKPPAVRADAFNRNAERTTQLRLDGIVIALQTLADAR
jgi:hypothetical protein